MTRIDDIDAFLAEILSLHRNIEDIPIFRGLDVEKNVPLPPPPLSFPHPEPLSGKRQPKPPLPLQPPPPLHPSIPPPIAVAHSQRGEGYRAIREQ